MQDSCDIGDGQPDDVSELASARHTETMKRVRSRIVFREITRKVTGLIDEIVAGHDAGPTICFIHSVLGTSTEVLDFAEALGPEFRLLSIRPSSARRNGDFGSSIEAMAEAYVQALVERQPEGQLVLCGRSAGVVIGLHMAELLRARGRPIALFCALDFAPYNTGADIGGRNVGLLWQRVKGWARLFSTEMKESASWKELADRLLAILAAKRAMAARSELENKFQLVDLSQFRGDEVDFIEACDRAMRSYRYREKCRFPVLVLTSTKEPDRTEYNVRRKWLRIAARRNLTFVTIPGTTHRSIGELPHVCAATKHLQNQISRIGLVQRYNGDADVAQPAYQRKG